MIRRAKESDAQRLAELIDGLNAHEGKPPAFDARVVLRDGFGEQRRFHALVSERGGRVEGYAMYNLAYDTDRGVAQVYLVDLFVADDARRAGVGGELVASLAREARTLGAPVMFWTVRETNAVARAFYAKLGAVDANARVMEIDGARLDELAGRGAFVPAHDVELRGERVLLRPVLERDVASLTSILAEPEVAAWWPDHGEGEVREMLAYDEMTTIFTIEHEARAIGVIQTWSLGVEHYPWAGVDIFVTSKLHRRGLGSDAIRTLVRWLMEERGHHRLTIDPDPENVAAVRAYERCGFRRVGVMEAYERRADGTYRDGLLMELVRKKPPRASTE